MSVFVCVQGSAKLEKAEILQMTVEHLKLLQARGLNNPGGLECDYRSVGYRECVGEVARYLASEGVEVHHPVRTRLLHHLETYGAQKEVALKAELSGYSSWPRLATYTTPQAPGLYPPQNSSDLLKLKDCSSAGCYPTTYPTYLAQTTAAQPTAFQPSATSLGNFSTDNIYSSNYGALTNTVDPYKFRPW